MEKGLNVFLAGDVSGVESLLMFARSCCCADAEEGSAASKKLCSFDVRRPVKSAYPARIYCDAYATRGTNSPCALLQHKTQGGHHRRVAAQALLLAAAAAACCCCFKKVFRIFHRSMKKKPSRTTEKGFEKLCGVRVTWWQPATKN